MLVTVQSASTCGSGSGVLFAMLVTRVSLDFSGTGGGGERRCVGLGFITKSGTSSDWPASVAATGDSAICSAVSLALGDFGDSWHGLPL